MLTKKEFISILNILEEEIRLSEELNKALQGYTQDKEFTGFLNTRFSQALHKWLKDTMNDQDDFISWYYETPTSNIDCHTVYINTESFIINTKEALYDLLTNALKK